MKLSTKILSVAFVVAVAFAISATASAAIVSNLTVGSTGAEVVELQTALVNGGYLTMPAGVPMGYFGALTKAAVIKYQIAKGITPAAGYVGPITRASLAAAPVTPTTPSTGLSGDAGDLTVTKTSTDVESSVKEGQDDVNVIGVKAEAEGSDIAITNVKVTLKNASTTDGSSEKLSNYLDEVSIFLGSKKIGSADVSDFSRTIGTPDTFTKSISTKNAVIKDGDDAKLYVAVTATSNIDTDDLVAKLNVVIDNIRFEDATGAILTVTPASNVSSTGEDIAFDDISTDDKIDAKSSSSNPDNKTVLVDTNSTSDDFLALAFKLDVDEDSSDVSITSLPVTLTVTNGGTSADSIEDIVDAVTVSIDGKDYDADLTTDNIENGSSTAVYTVEFDSDEVVIDSGDVANVEVTLAFNEQGGTSANYANNTTVTASVVPANIDAETEADEITVGGGTKTGATLTLNTAAAMLTNPSWSVTSAGTIVDFFFTIEAQDNDVDVLAADIASSTAGTAATSVGTLTKFSGDDVTPISGGFTVAEGDKTTFRVRYNVSGTNGQWSEVTITSVAGQDIPDDKQTSPTATLNVNS